MESRTQWQLYRMFQQQQDESLHISYVPPAAPPPDEDEVRDTLACPATLWVPPMGVPPAVGVVGCSSGESRLPFPPPPPPAVTICGNKKYLKDNVSLLSLGLGVKTLIKHNLIIYLGYVPKFDMCDLN